MSLLYITEMDDFKLIQELLDVGGFTRLEAVLENPKDKIRSTVA